MKEVTLNKDVIRSEFVKGLEQLSGQNVNVCFQCMKCTSGCPVSAFMDLHPAQIVHALRLGQEELVMGSTTPWLCASCQTCTTRCPQELDLAGLMDAVRIMAQRRGVEPPVPDVKAFYDACLGSIRKHGRMHELGMIMKLKFSTWQLFKDAGLGWRMFWKGKLKFFASNVGAEETEKIFERVRELEGDDQEKSE